MTELTSFWGRRRAGVKAEVEAEARQQSEADVAARVQAQSEKDDATLLQEMGLPDPDALQGGDDFAAFMAKEVPEHLKNKALRVLWRSNPVLACVDGLNEYDDDYRAAMLAAEPIKTAYQVGKGMLAHVQEVARQKEAAELAAQAPDVEIPIEPEEAVPERKIVTETPQEVAEAALGEEVETDTVPQRMRFRFEEGATS